MAPLIRPYSTLRSNFGSNSGASTVSGNTLFLTTVAQNNRLCADRFANTLWVFAVNIVAGADTVLQACSVNGQPAKINVQANTAGFISAIVSYYGWEINDSLVPRAVVNTTGTAPTASRFCFTGVTGLSSGIPVATASATTVAAISSNVTLPCYAAGYYVCAAINNVGAANSCTWTGTNAPSETDDAAIGAARSTASERFTATESQAYSITSTWAVMSTTGISLAVASWR